MTLFLVGGRPNDDLADVNETFAASVSVQARGRKDPSAPKVAFLAEAGRLEALLPDYTADLLRRLPDCQIIAVPLSNPDGTTLAGQDHRKTDLDQHAAPEQNQDSPQNQALAADQAPDGRPDSAQTESEQPEQPGPEQTAQVPVTEPVSTVPAATLPDDLDAVILADGHSPTLLTALAGLRNQLSRLVHADVPFIGYAAGAAVAARHAYVGGWRVEGYPVANENTAHGLDDVAIVDGLALVTPLILPHNNTEHADGLATSCLEQNWARTAVALDDLACLIVDPISGRTANYGKGRIRWFTREAGGVLVRTQYPDA